MRGIRTQVTRKYLTAAAVAGLVVSMPIQAQTPASARITYVVQSSALTKFSQAIGTMSGDAGNFDVKVPVPCFPDFWNACGTITLYSERVRWTVTDPTFAIDPNGLTFNGHLEASYGPFRYQVVVSGDALPVYSPGGSAVQLHVNAIRVPITFDLPAVGPW